MARFRLATVLRARLAQEDQAKAEVVRARSGAGAAKARERDRERALRGTDLPTGVSGQAVVAALAARRALAEDLAAASHGVAVAEVHIDSRLAELAEAAKRRRVVERLGERHAAVEQARVEAAEQRDTDEIAAIAAARKEPWL